MNAKRVDAGGVYLEVPRSKTLFGCARAIYDTDGYISIHTLTGFTIFSACPAAPPSCKRPELVGVHME